MIHEDYKNTRGSNMDEPLWCSPNHKPKRKLTPEEERELEDFHRRLKEIGKEFKAEHEAREKNK